VIEFAGRCAQVRAERRIFAHASECPRAGSDAQNSQLWLPDGLSVGDLHAHLSEAMRSTSYP